MSVSVRSYLAAGVALVATGIIAIPSSVPPRALTAATVPRDDVQVTRRVDLAASVRPLPAELPSPATFAAAVAVIERIDPTARRTASRAVAPAVSAAVAPAPLDTASNVVTAGYQAIQYWVDYGVQLTTYVLGFIPYGYPIANQVNIVYYNLIRPIADSVVYGLINPVLNDPLNLAAYVNGFIAVGQTTINALINTGIAEFNNFFGWLIPPLPPLPSAVATTVPVVAKQAAAALVATVPAAAEPVKAQSVEVPKTATETATEAPKTTDATPATKSVEAVEAVEATKTPVATESTTAPEPSTAVVEPTKTTSSANGVQAQGEVRDATVGAVTTKTTPTDTDDAPRKDPAPATSTNGSEPTKTATTTSTGSVTKADDGPAAKTEPKTDEPKKAAEKG